MRKGLLESTIGLLFALVFLGAMVSLFWIAIRGSGESPPEQPEKEFTISSTGGCSTDEQCTNNRDGTICLTIGSFDSSLKAFCGCRTSEDCKTGVCNEKNICE